MNSLRILFVLFAASALASCGLFLTNKEKAMQKDPNYKSGYSDGCASSNAENTRYRGDTHRDEALFSTSAAYRNGWHSGFSACSSNFATDPTTQRSAVPDPGPPH